MFLLPRGTLGLVFRPPYLIPRVVEYVLLFIPSGGRSVAFGWSFLCIPWRRRGRLYQCCVGSSALHGAMNAGWASGRPTSHGGT